MKYLNLFNQEYIFVPARNVNLEDLGVFASLIFYQNFVHYISQKLTIFDLKYKINHSKKFTKFNFLEVRFTNNREQPIIMVSDSIKLESARDDRLIF